MKKVINRYKSKEELLRTSLTCISIKTIWVILTILWVVIGTYLYNEKLPTRNTITKVLFLLITLAITWQNKESLKVFFKNPFKSVGKTNSISNVLWMYPFGILMVSVIFVLIPTLFGWVHDDPQNLNEMTLTFSKSSDSSPVAAA